MQQESQSQELGRSPEDPWQQTTQQVRDAAEIDLLFRWGKRIFQGGMALIAMGMLLGLSILAARTYRIEATHTELQRIQAEYKWQHQSYERKMRKTPQVRCHRMLAEWLGNSLVSDFSVVRIDGPLNDGQLRFLHNLRAVRVLELHSDLATDATLTMLSKLPHLQHLTIIGNRFTVKGLLQLRESASLDRIRFGGSNFSPIELAVIESEIPATPITEPTPAMPSVFAQDLPLPSRVAKTEFENS